MSGVNAISVIRSIFRLWILLFPMLTFSAENSSNESDAKLDSIAVKGISGARKLTGELLGRVISEYERLKPEFAPESSLKFYVAKKFQRRSTDPSLSLLYYYDESFEKEKIDIRGDGSIPVDEIPYGKYPSGELLLNRKSEEYWFQVSVVTPGRGRRDIRVGDLRLQCRLHWMINKGDYSVILQAKAVLLGGACEVGLMPGVILEKNVKSLEITGASKGKVLYAINANVIKVNHHSPDIPNDAIIHIEYIDQ